MNPVAELADHKGSTAPGVAQPAQRTALRLRIARRVELAERVIGLDLTSADGSRLPAYSPGAHIELSLPNGIKRQYSLYGPSNGQTYSIGVLHADDSRGGSRAVHELLAAGDVLEASAPRNQFALRDNGKPALLLAAGIGITPIIAMADALHAARRPFELHYVTRSIQRTVFAERIRSGPFGDRAHLYIHDGHSPHRLVVRELLREQAVATDVYVCGPQRFIQAAIDVADELGWPKDSVCYELFGTAGQAKKADAQHSSFEVELALSGKIIRIAPDKTIVEAMLAEGLEPNTSCEQGVCGTCLTRVLDGTPDHRDSYLTDEEKCANDQMLICCSRAKSGRLVLEL